MQIFSSLSLQHEERAFVLKFSAMEIYNEVVRDLLGTDNSPLRLLDDPEVSFLIYFHLVGLFGCLYRSNSFINL